MNQTLKSALRELKSEGVILDPIDDLEHILTLDKLSNEIDNPTSAPGEVGAFCPSITVGGLTLYRLSIGANRFYTETCVPWLDGDAYRQDLAYAFCMAHSNTPEVLWSFAVPPRSTLKGARDRFIKALGAWEKTLTVSMAELTAAIKAFLDTRPAGSAPKPGPRAYRSALATLHAWRPIPDAYRLPAEAALVALEAENAETPECYGPVIEMLTREHGRTREDWLWRTPEDEIEMLLYNRAERIDSEDRDQYGRFMRAHRAFCMYKDLVARIKKGVAS